MTKKHPLLIALGFVATAMLLSPAAQAALGGAPTLPADSATGVPATSLKAAVGTAASGTLTAAAYTVRQQTLPNGVNEREFVNADGVVFGIAWNGPFPPNLKDFMGDNVFAQYASAVQAAQGQGRRGGAVAVETNGVVAQAGGHQRSFAGRAYVPALLPAGVDASAVQ